MLLQIISIVGAICLLIGYYLAGRDSNNANPLNSIIFNIIGSAILTITAALALQYGFVILEGVWCTISIKNLVNHLRLIS